MPIIFCARSWILLRGLGAVFYPFHSSGKGLNNLTFLSNKLEGTELDLGMNSSESLAVGVTQALIPFLGPLRLSSSPGS